MNAVARRVKNRRVELGLSQRALEVPGVSFAYISRIESGSRTPSLRALTRLAERLDCTALYLLTGHEDDRCPVCGRSG